MIGVQVYRETKVENTFVWIRKNELKFKVGRDDPMMVQVLENEIVSMGCDTLLVEDSLSVDLTTFPGNLLHQRGQGGIGHPRVNKAPILALEIFGCRNRQPAYTGLQSPFPFEPLIYGTCTILCMIADVVLGNEAVLADEMEMEDFFDDEDDEEEETLGELQERLLSLMEEIGPVTDAASLIFLLEKLVKEATPVTLPMEKVKERLEEMVLGLDSENLDMSERVQIMIALTRLYQVGMKVWFASAVG